MVTTAVVAEIVVAGLQALTWLALLVLAIFGTDWVDVAVVSDWVVPITLLMVAAAYMLGVLIDRLADDLALRGLDRVWPVRPVDKPADIVRMRMELLAKDDGVARFLDYQRSRMRIARVTLLNLLLLIPSLTAFLVVRVEPRTWVVVLVAALILAAAVATASVYRTIECAYVSRLSDAYRVANRLADPADLAAAVCCCRSKDGGALFQLVPAEGGWAFPTGRKQSGKSLPEAAVREARQAGIAVRIDATRLLEYRRAAARSDDEDELVTAFLFEARNVRSIADTAERIWRGREAALLELAAQPRLDAVELDAVLQKAEREVERRAGRFRAPPSAVTRAETVAPV